MYYILVLILHSYSYFLSLEFLAIVLPLWDSLRQLTQCTRVWCCPYMRFHLHYNLQRGSRNCPALPLPLLLVSEMRASVQGRGPSNIMKDEKKSMRQQQTDIYPQSQRITVKLHHSEGSLSQKHVQVNFTWQITPLNASN